MISLVFSATTNFADKQLWSLLVQIGILCVALVLGNMVRRKVPFIKRSLIPSALIGGVLIFILTLIPGVKDLIDKSTMEVITYHTLGLGFIALTLKDKAQKKDVTSMKIVETGALTASTYIIQGIVGLGCSIILFFIMDFFFAGGLLLPMGFGQGPGQALNFGNLYESKYAFKGGSSFGLSIAAIGFVVASIVGVVYMNILRKKGKLTRYSEDIQVKNTLEDFEKDNEIPNSESIDKLSIQVALVFGIYFLVYLFLILIESLDLGSFGTDTLKPLFWGFNFLWGVIFATIVKKIMDVLKKKKVMHREYKNNYLLDRISGLMFDMMIVAGTAAIEFDEVKDLIIPLIIICTIGTIVTFIYVKKTCDHLYTGYTNEAFFAMFGMLTGTASNGMILLREIDPKFETPASTNLVLQNFPAIAFGFPVILLLSFAPKGLTQSFVTLGIIIVMFILFNLFLYRKKIFKKKESLLENKNKA